MAAACAPAASRGPSLSPQPRISQLQIEREQKDRQGDIQQERREERERRQREQAAMAEKAQAQQAAAEQVQAQEPVQTQAPTASQAPTPMQAAAEQVQARSRRWRSGCLRSSQVQAQ